MTGNASKLQPQSPYWYEDLPGPTVPLKSSDKNDQLNLALTSITMGPSTHEDLETIPQPPQACVASPPSAPRVRTSHSRTLI